MRKASSSWAYVWGWWGVCLCYWVGRRVQLEECALDLLPLSVLPVHAGHPSAHLLKWLAGAKCDANNDIPLRKRNTVELL